jgi:hypothetical protein
LFCESREELRCFNCRGVEAREIFYKNLETRDNPEEFDTDFIAYMFFIHIPWGIRTFGQKLHGKDAIFYIEITEKLPVILDTYYKFKLKTKFVREIAGIREIAKYTPNSKKNRPVAEWEISPGSSDFLFPFPCSIK